MHGLFDHIKRLARHRGPRKCSVLLKLQLIRMQHLLLFFQALYLLRLAAGCPFISKAGCRFYLNKVDSFEFPEEPPISAVATDTRHSAQHLQREGHEHRGLVEHTRYYGHGSLRPRRRNKRFRPLEILPKIPEAESVATECPRQPGQSLGHHANSMDRIRVLNQFGLVDWSADPVKRADISSAIRMFFLDPARQFSRLRPLLIDQDGFLHREVRNSGMFAAHGAAEDVPLKAVVDALRGPNRWMARLLQRMAQEVALFKTNEDEYKTEAWNDNKRVVEITRRSFHPPRALFIIVSGNPSQEALRSEFRRAEREYHECIPSATTVRTLSRGSSV